ncbi:MAG TPA: GNAT family N-acetyltransferase [Thermomicrobiaceae bacterium]|nr:GNAT family N-acetyltransferase [Thermomicrobiaceae bacterium]
MIGFSHRNLSPAGPSPLVQPLRLVDVPRLRLGWSSRFDAEEIEHLLRAEPGLGLWVPETGEYVVGGAWRHRQEVAAVVELSATANAPELLAALADAAEQLGKRLVIASEHAETRRRAFYDSAGYELVEEILIYELTRVGASPVAPADPRFERVDADDEATLAELIALDHAAFPWLWWNSREEFDNYGQSPGVEIYLGRDQEGRAVSYVGVTRFRTWGHLDRIAVAPDLRGQGLGLRSLEWAVATLSAASARRIGLSTQARNSVSRRLYERFGFRRVPSQDYSLYGRWLGDGRQA